MIKINKRVINNFFLAFNKNRNYFGIVKFPLPDLGEKIKEGKVKKLYVREGTQVKSFQKIADVESDKQFTEITAPAEGTIVKILFKEDQICQVGQVFLQYETNEKIQQNKDTKQVQRVNQKSNSIQPSKIIEHKHTKRSHHVFSDNLLTSPVVIMLAKQHGIDLRLVKPSGRKERILKGDILQYIENRHKIVSKINQNPKKETSIKKPVVVKMNSFEKGMQKSMSESNKIPHLYYHQQFEIENLQRIRLDIKKSGKKITLMTLILKTFSIALLKHPKINSTYTTDKQYEYETHKDHNVSIAIDSSNGLVVPSIKKLQTLSILNIQKELQVLKELSNQGKLTNSHLTGGTICLSNIGTIGGISACPLILPPQVCIVAIGKITEQPTIVSNEPKKTKFITMSYGCDHRVLDGAYVARFSNTWKELIQNPYLSLLHMV